MISGGTISATPCKEDEWSSFQTLHCHTDNHQPDPEGKSLEVLEKKEYKSWSVSRRDVLYDGD